MRVLIIEDEPIAVQRLTTMLREIDREIQVTGVIESVEAGIAYFKEPEQLDLVFMDIELGDGQSFKIVEQAQIDVPIIFITAYSQHTLKAFKLNSIDYLLKPLNSHELTQAILKYRKLHAQPKKPADLAALLKDLQGGRQRELKERFLARTGTRLISASIDQIAYFYTKDKLQYIKTVKNEDLVIDKRLDEIENEVDGRLFFRANRQFIVNYNNIDKVHAWFSGKLKVQVNPAAYEDIIVSRLRAAEFKKWLGE
ncbi:MAG TPA: LytTR family DNA-binding domain-containing protein [Chitinophagaceae bacterium]|nr:LytTR family DNA-binding domain-containing protein [Chitinophagaceae bacterium]